VPGVSHHRFTLREGRKCRKKKTENGYVKRKRRKTDEDWEKKRKQGSEGKDKLGAYKKIGKNSTEKEREKERVNKEKVWIKTSIFFWAIKL
jgi:hypothetical protein